LLPELELRDPLLLLPDEPELRDPPPLLVLPEVAELRLKDDPEGRLADPPLLPEFLVGV